MLTFCQWGKLALDCLPSLMHWIKSWPVTNLEVLTPKQWYSRGHNHAGGYAESNTFWRLQIKRGTFLWDLPPSAADAALEELRKARIKRQKSTHIVLIPRLFTPLWLKLLLKSCDLVVYILPQYSFWGSDQFEPLCIGICFPYLMHRPWQLRGTLRMRSVERKVQSCAKKTNWTQGLFCVNYFKKRAGFLACHNSWCGKCYTIDPTLKLHIKHQKH